MAKTVLNGDQAMACGALASAVKVVTGYPGAPSLGTVQTLIKLAKTHHFFVWSGHAMKRSLWICF